MNILYLSYTGLTEPLGVSQVLAYLRGLARDHRITLVSFEKPAELANAALMAELHATCAAAGIRWVPRRYHHRPRLAATLWDLTVFFATALREARAMRADIIHARAYIATFVAALTGMLTRTPFIFDTRSFWPEEMIAAGRLRRGSLLHRLIATAERVCLREAAGVVFLTRAAADHVRREDPMLATTDMVVIPTCADLTRFVPADRPATLSPLHAMSVGTLLSGWFRTDLMFRFFAALQRAEPKTRLTIHTRDDPVRVKELARAAGLEPAALEVSPLPAAEVPAAMRQAHVLPMFYKTGLARLAGFPTRMAEALGSGVPVIANGDAGEVATIVAENRVGVLVDGEDEAAMATGVRELLILLDDPQLAARCRSTAERLFSVDGGVDAYRALYRRIAARRA